MSYTTNLNIGWNAGAKSRKVCFGDCQVNFQVPTSNSGVVCGLNNSDQSADFREVLYAFYLTKTPSGPSVAVYESGQQKFTGSSYASTDLFTVRRVATTITYLQNGVVVYTSDTPSTGGLFVDSSLYAGGDNIG